MGGMGGGSNILPRGSPQIFDRLISAVSYLLPFFNSFVYARFLYMTTPLVRTCLKPILPAISAYSSFPMASFIAFFGLYLGVVNNRSMPRFARFNAMQAALLDISLVLPRLLETVITPPSAGWGAQIYVQCQSAIWIVITACVLYGMISSLLGQYGRIPFIAEAADGQVQ